jgi:dimethylargininase
LLHLKSAIAFVGDTFVVASSMRDHPALQNKPAIVVDDDEAYAANCIEINGRVFVAAGFPRAAAALKARGFEIVALEMSEFEKMDGGLSCLSLRF